MATLDFENAIPLYQQVADDIRQKITEGTYKEGQMLPSEAKCCEIYSVSRVTVRNAITDLVEQGLLLKKHGKGTFVAKQKIPSDLFRFNGFTTTCRENNIKIMTRILCARKQEASMHDIRVLNLSKDDDIVYLKRLRYADGHPVIIEHVHLPYRQFAFLLEMNIEDRSLYEMIQEHTGMDIEHQCYSEIILEASAATPEEAHFLHIDDNYPLFILKETIHDLSGKPIHWTKQIMASNYFQFNLTASCNTLSIRLDS